MYDLFVPPGWLIGILAAICVIDAIYDGNELLSLALITSTQPGSAGGKKVMMVRDDVIGGGGGGAEADAEGKRFQCGTEEFLRDFCLTLEKLYAFFVAMQEISPTFQCHE